jgi:N-glycosylase/DNA lyase
MGCGMSLQIINKAIMAMCGEVASQASANIKWRQMTEAQLFYEVVVCIAGSQMLFEMAVGIADHLRVADLLNPSTINVEDDTYEASLAQSLSRQVLMVDKDGVSHLVNPRFRNRLASLIASTAKNIYGEGQTIKKTLRRADGARSARAVLVSTVCGFGPKQASLFLRRIGYCSELAVLDVHVLDYLELAKGFSIKASTLGRLSVYERVEDEFRAIAMQFGHAIGCVDLAMWVTMRVAKQEAYI